MGWGRPDGLTAPWGIQVAAAKEMERVKQDYGHGTVAGPEMGPESVTLGFDPGRDKCGVAAVTGDRRVLSHEVVPASGAITVLAAWLRAYGCTTLVLGDRTSSRAWRQRLEVDLTPSPTIVLVDEHNTTLLARDRYWQMYPPHGLQRFIPQGLREPPRPLDDIAAILLVERYFDAIAAPQSLN